MQKILAGDAAAGDRFGFSVAVAGDTAVVGARSSAGNTGSAYVFVRNGAGVWTQQQKLTAGDAAAGALFGYSVAISGDTAVVGAIHDAVGGTGSGAAYVFTRDSGGVWTQQQKLTASDAAANDNFGVAVGVSGDTAVVGAWWDDAAGGDSGSAYVFTRSGAAWVQQQKLTATDAAAGDRFGRSVAIAGDTAMVGAYHDDDAGGNSGSAYAFTRSSTTWTQQAKLTAGDAAADDLFGHSVAISGDTAVVGAYKDDDGGSNSGSAYVFTRNGTGAWTQQAKLTASDAATNDEFGTAVAVSGHTAVVGAWRDTAGGYNSGAAYVYTRDGAAWTQQSKLTASDPAAFDQFAYSVAISGDTVVLGANYDDDGFTDNGSAYIFTTPCLSLTLAHNEWALLGPPCDLGTANTVNNVFTDANGFMDSMYWDGASGDWAVFRRSYDDPDVYAQMALTDPIETGYSYWAKFVGIAGDTRDAVFNGSPNEIPIDTLLQSFPTGRYNMVSHPFNQSVPWPEIGVVEGTTGMDIDQANLDCSTPGPSCRMSSVMHKYNPTSGGYDAFNGATPGMMGTLNPGEGFWVQAYKQNLSLRIPPVVLFGAQNVNVSGTLYDVEFVDGTCEQVYGGGVPGSCTTANLGPFSGSFALAQSAANALNAQVFTDQGGATNFDSYPDQITGCSHRANCGHWVPYNHTGSLLQSHRADNNAPGANTVNFEGVSPTIDSSVLGNRVWTRWTVAPTSAMTGKDASARLVTTQPANEEANRAAGTGAGWQVQLSAAGGEKADSHNYFGQLADSVVGYDRHDLPELDPFDSTYLTVVFSQQQWGSQSGYYTSDHRDINRRGTGNWDFEVHTSLPAGTEVTLTWDGPERALNTARLIDHTGNYKAKVGTDGSYTFTVTAPVHQFTWQQRPWRYNRASIRGGLQGK